MTSKYRRSRNTYWGRMPLWQKVVEVVAGFGFLSIPFLLWFMLEAWEAIK